MKTLAVLRHVAGPVRRALWDIRIWWRHRSDSRHWTAQRQLDHLRELMLDDAVWLTHDRTASLLLDRYLEAASPGWYRRVYLPMAHFRHLHGLEPSGRGRS